MTIYEIIKAAISVKQAAKHYGLNVNRNGMACCPFHNDRHPSLKLNEDYFFCFGCGAKGDVIDLVARLFDLSSYEAAQKLSLIHIDVYKRQAYEHGKNTGQEIFRQKHTKQFTSTHPQH